MLHKEQLLRIPELSLAAVINTMTDSQFADYVQTLDDFIDKFPDYANKLRDALQAGQYDLMIQRLAELHYILTKLQAYGMAAECYKQIVSLTDANQPDIDPDAIEVYIEILIQDVATLSIEIQMAEHKSTDTALPPPYAGWQMGARPSILAVDDAAVFLSTLEKLLSGSPYELHCMKSGAEALEFLQHNQPNAILLDIEMPVMDGYELARRIKQSGNTAPILFITANSDREYVDKAFEVGAVGLLMKPLRLNQLLAKLNEII